LTESQHLQICVKTAIIWFREPFFKPNERQLALTSQPTPGRQHFLFPIVTVLVLPYPLEAIWIPLCQRTKGV
ncbi:MAG TPA: hypothetical protein DCS90_00855, partial [Ktedonobacter sp.]|nr:hypothetical protein [Ktedonobacter sp.]